MLIVREHVPAGRSFASLTELDGPFTAHWQGLSGVLRGFALLTADQVHPGRATLLATHPRSRVRGAWVVEESHWDGLPDGHTRATVIELPHRDRPMPAADPAPDTLAALLTHRRVTDIHVVHRPLSDYALGRRSRAGGPMKCPDRAPHSHPRTRLGLPELAENVTELTARAEQAQLGYLNFLDQLLKDDVGAEQSRRFRNALRLSGLPHHRGLDKFDFAFQAGLDAAGSKTPPG